MTLARKEKALLPMQMAWRDACLADSAKKVPNLMNPDETFNHFPFFNVENLVFMEHIERKSKLPLWPEYNLCTF